MMYRALRRSTGSASALTMTSGPLPAGSPLVIAMVGRASMENLRFEISNFKSPLTPPLPSVCLAFKPEDDCFRDDVRFQIERPADRPGAQGGQAEGGRNQGHFKSIAPHGRDGQTDAIHGHRAFWHDIPGQIGRRANGKSAFPAIVLTRQQRRDAVNM